MACCGPAVAQNGQGQAQKALVSTYYGQDLKSSADLKTTACTAAEVPTALRKLMKDVHPQVLARFYGCGDCFLAARLVGETGSVVGVDMTEEQLGVAMRYLDWHMERYEYHKPNVRFARGQIEDLRSAGIQDASMDVVISNCVMNLSPDKRAVLREALRVLKPGGELHFSDVFCDRRLPAELLADKELLGECLAGAMYVQDFRRLLATLGCHDYRVTGSAEIRITDERIRAKVGHARFFSVTVRCFKLEELEDGQEDYGQVAYYLGSPSQPLHLDLDMDTRFEVGRPVLVSGNTALMLTKTRYSRYFRVLGDKAQHFGAFRSSPCATEPPVSGSAKAPKPVELSCCKS